MGGLHEASALVHTGIRAARRKGESNFVCSPASILLAFFIAMKGAQDSTLLQMQRFLGTSDLPALPSASPLPQTVDVPLGPYETSESTPSPAWVSSALHLWEHFSELIKGRNRAHAVFKSENQMREEPRNHGNLTCRLLGGLYVTPETANTEAFKTYAKNVQAATDGRAAAHSLDLSKVDEAVAAVNSFVAEATEGRIPQLLAPGSLSSQTRLLIVATAFFKSNWQTPFHPLDTERRTFYALKPTSTQETSAEEEEMTQPGAHVSEPGPASLHAQRLVPQNVWTMFVQLKKPPFYVLASRECLAVGLPYKNTQYTMFIIMPLDSSKLPLLTVPVEKRLEMGFEDTVFPDADLIISAMKLMAQKRTSAAINLHLPKFHSKAFENNVDLAEVFARELGVTIPFSPGEANFEKIDGGLESLSIERFAHSADIEVDETGTEAAGGSAVSIGVRCLRAPPAKVFDIHITQPFMYQIRYTAAKPTINHSEGPIAELSEAEMWAAAAAAKHENTDDVILFSGEIVDAAAAQS